jgi:Flp pilus assembly protein TadD
VKHLVALVSIVGVFIVVGSANSFQDEKSKNGLPNEPATLADADALGKVVDVQGLAFVRPALSERWTPICGTLVLKPGDWLRTDLRGANALQVRAKNGGGLILGPGSLVEIVSADEFHATSGEFEISGPKEAKLTVRGPDGAVTAVEGTKVFRVQTDKAKKREVLVALSKEPKWLAGFKGAIVNETLGSLVAKVDGRNVPLTVGYHKVTVDIRDQIARTTIEESFVNHTDGVLEGVFYFPLPADASISGFGMWIGDELVEADVVEKQRAREIYETILREKRDPGLLEWSGGNLFKARVYPINARSEKRIKITYTQVLPLAGSSYRYSYALQSELLKQNPLRELAIKLTVHSTAELRGVNSTTHSVRKQQTKHSAQLEFTAQEYTPDRDFEVVVDVERQGQEVVVVPHQRGDDGYLLMLINPPGGGKWERDVLRDGEPLNLLILADTSGSMDARAREAQADFVAALLSSLGPKDSFNLATCDTTCNWANDEPQRAHENSIQAAREFLARRRSLGWTDLEAAFHGAIERVTENTHVVYIGDGINTTIGSDPNEFARRLREMHAGKGTFHAVAPGSTYEQVALQTIASLGGGSVRRLAADRDPKCAGSAANVARQLLAEIAAPALRDLAIEFHGLQVARVYPERLPNLPFGSQQIVIGRYLPDAQATKGEVIVSGTQNGKPVRYHTTVSFADAARQAKAASEQSAADEHSFIPRLWARMHLDFLLSQGQAQVIQDEIIALSEDYQIMTPYTSFLVLESDADRERFKVKRTFRMRDGEKFFAKGQDDARYELTQQQMKRAGTWRLDMRRQILRELALLGRRPNQFRVEQGQVYRSKDVLRRSDSWFGRGVPGMAGGGGRYGGVWDSSGESLLSLGDSLADAELPMSRTAGEPVDKKSYFDANEPEEAAARGEGETDRLASVDEATPAGAEIAEQLDELVQKREFAKEAIDMDSDYFAENGRKPMSGPMASLRALDARTKAGIPFAEDLAAAGDWSVGFKMMAGRPGRYSQYPYSPGLNWLQQLIPDVPAPPSPDKPLAEELRWPDDARQLAESLLRRDELMKLSGGLWLEIDSETFDVRRRQTASKSYERTGIGGKRWTQRSWSDTSQTTLSWVDGKERGTASLGYGLAAAREAADADREMIPLSLSDWSLTSLERSYPGYKTTIERQGDDRVQLTLRAPADSNYEVRLIIDTKRHVLIKSTTYSAGKLQATTTFSAFVDVAGTHWATRVETTDDQGRTTSTVRIRIKELTSDELTARLAEELKGRGEWVVVKSPLPTVRQAKQALKDGKADINHRLTLLVYEARTQQWDEVRKHFDDISKIVGERYGRRWLEFAVQMMTRRNEELRKGILAETKRLAEQAAAGRETNNAYALATSLFSQASSVLESNEMLSLLDAIRPVYVALPPYAQGDKLWKQQRVSYLQNVGQQDEAFALLAELAKAYRYDYSLATQYANQLAGRGEYEAAYAWLRELVADRSLEWHAWELDQLRSTHVQLLEQEGRVADLVEYLAAWIKLEPESATPYQQYLSALQRHGEETKVDELVEKWLAEGREAIVETAKRNEGKKPHEQQPPAAAKTARLSAAVNYATGNYGPYWNSRLEEKWVQPLAETVRVVVRHGDPSWVANTIMQHHHFRNLDAARELRREFVELLLYEGDKLPPARMNQLVGFIAHNDPKVEVATWRQIAEVFLKRWSVEKETGPRRELAQTLVHVYGHIGQEELIAFLERQLNEGPKDDRLWHVQQLFDTLLAQTWRQQYEDRLYALLKDVGERERQPNEDEADYRLARIVAKLDALYRLNDRMVQARYEAAMADVEHQEKLTRSELADKRKEALKQAREAVADRLVKQRDEYGDELRTWMVVERTYLDVQLGRKLDEAEAEAWEYVGAAPAPVDVEAPMARVELILRNRHLTTLAYLSTRKNAKTEIAERLVKYYEAGIGREDEAAYWKAKQFRLLVALDRPEALETALRTWSKPDDADNTWRLALGYLLAEQAKFNDAIALFEQVRAADELGPSEYRALADWYMVVDQRDKHEEASIAAYMAEGERRLQARLNAYMNPWHRGDDKLPSEINPEVFKIFAALFRKSEQPQNYIYQLQHLYRHTRDFRLLEVVADGVIGRSNLGIYSLLTQMHSLTSDVRDEATVDQLIEHLRRVRERSKTDVDRRALDLLEMVAERRAAELRNQAEPHVKAAVAALRRATKGEWADGERRLMANFLVSQGNIPAKALAAAQVEVAASLHAGERNGTFERLYLAHQLSTLYWYYSRPDDAINLLESALAEFRRASGGVLPQSANDTLYKYVDYLAQRGRYSRGEEVFQAELKTARNNQQRHWLVQQLYQLYNRAIGYDGTVSLGKGQKLYNSVEQRIRADINETKDHNHRYQLISTLTSIYYTAKNKQLSGYANDLRQFAFEQLPEVLKRQTNNYQSIVQNVAGSLHQVASPRDGLAFLIERIENEPSWLRYQHQDGWSQHAWQLGEWRREVGASLGDLEPRLLKIVLNELRRDLDSMQSRNRNMYQKHSHHYWAEKEQDFARVAEEVLERHMKSSAQILYIAQYVWGGVEHYDRAIQILAEAHQRKVLDESARAMLVIYLHGRGRHAESIAIVLPLVELRPDNMTYRVQLMHAYFHTGQKEKLLAALAATDSYFHEHNLWNENNIQALAFGTLQDQLFEQSVAYFKEAISLHERTQPNRGIGNGTLSSYYQGLANAHAGLKQTPEAVEAAGAAIVSWGKQIERRADALNSLKEVLKKSSDLDAYVKHLDAQVEETGLENPIVRKAVGMVYFERSDFKKAIAQLKKAVETQPNDAETHRTLVAAYDNAGDKEGAIAQLFASVELSRREIALYKDLATRFQAAGKADDAERAYTTIVEMLPSESESHTMLAEVRQTQDRWQEAARHWERVAEIRKLEPTGLLKLASAQIQLKHFNEAKQTIRQLEKRDWPTRFGDVPSQVRQLEQRLGNGRS